LVLAFIFQNPLPYHSGYVRTCTITITDNLGGDVCHLLLSSDLSQLRELAFSGSVAGIRANGVCVCVLVSIILFWYLDFGFCVVVFLLLAPRTPPWVGRWRRRCCVGRTIWRNIRLSRPLSLHSPHYNPAAMRWVKG